MFKTFSEVQQESTIIEIGTLVQRLCIGTDTDVPSTYIISKNCYYDLKSSTIAHEEYRAESFGEKKSLEASLKQIQDRSRAMRVCKRDPKF